MTIFLSIIIILLSTLVGFLAWYSTQALKKIQFILESVETLDLGLQSFEQHLKYIYELEMYYGDETLENLISHAKDVSSSFIEFRKDYEIYNGIINEEEYLENAENAEKESDHATG